MSNGCGEDGAFDRCLAFSMIVSVIVRRRRAGLCVCVWFVCVRVCMFMLCDEGRIRAFVKSKDPFYVCAHLSSQKIHFMSMSNAQF